MAAAGKVEKKRKNVKKLRFSKETMEDICERETHRS